MNDDDLDLDLDLDLDDDDLFNDDDEKGKPDLATRLKNAPKSPSTIAKEQKARKEAEALIANKALEKRDESIFYKKMISNLTPDSKIFTAEQKNVLKAMTKTITTTTGKKTFNDEAKYYIFDNFHKENQRLFLPAQEQDLDKALKTKDFRKAKMIVDHIKALKKKEEKDIITKGTKLYNINQRRPMTIKERRKLRDAQ